MSHSSVMPVAHRGASAYAPENTVAAFDEAVRLGCPAIEFDVRLSADGVPVVIHDETLNRTTSGRGPVAQATMLDLRRFDAGSWMHPRFAGIRVPSLDEALHAIAPSAMPVAELKVPIDPDLLVGHLKNHRVLEESLVLSFDDRWLWPLRQKSREMQLGVLADAWRDDLPARCTALGAAALVLQVDLLTLPRIERAQAQGLEVWCFTANDVGLVAACAAMGITGIITDKPDLIRSR